jgi:hypothetical protein
MNARTFRSVATILLAGVAACDKSVEAARVTVDYEQVANFHWYQIIGPKKTTETYSAASDSMFVMYMVTQITNTGDSAKAFTFYPDSVSTITTAVNGAIINKTVDPSPLDASKNLSTVSVDSGQAVHVGRCFIKTVGTYNLFAHLPLIHQMYQTQPVTMHDLAPSGKFVQRGEDYALSESNNVWATPLGARLDPIIDNLRNQCGVAVDHPAGA